MLGTNEENGERQHQVKKDPRWKSSFCREVWVGSCDEESGEELILLSAFLTFCTRRRGGEVMGSLKVKDF